LVYIEAYNDENVVFIDLFTDIFYFINIWESLYPLFICLYF